MKVSAVQRGTTSISTTRRESRRRLLPVNLEISAREAAPLT